MMLCLNVEKPTITLLQVALGTTRKSILSESSVS